MRISISLLGSSLASLTSMLALAQTSAPPPPLPPPDVPSPSQPASAQGSSQYPQQPQYPLQPNNASPTAYPNQPAPYANQPAPVAAPANPGQTQQPVPQGQPQAQPQNWQPASPPASNGPLSVDVGATTAGAGAAPTAFDDESPHEEAASEPLERDYTFLRHSSFMGATGLLHLVSADSSAPGTFRLSVLSNYYSGSGFLCPDRASCPQPPAGVNGKQDSLDRTGLDLTLSATVLPFLEAFAGMHSQATSDDFGRIQLLQVLGDTNLGVKGFTPRQPNNIFSFGALGDLRLLNGSGSVGIHAANITFRALGTLDLTNRTDAEKRIPLRFHTNLGYVFDNSSSIVSDTEHKRSQVITRIERFALGINKVDSVVFGIGGEFVHPIVQPFMEWTIDIPSNRQGYVCKPSQVSTGDHCLKNVSGMGAVPSRLTLGLRTTPWLKGLNGTLGLDIGTGGYATFIEEISPQIPWSLYIGVGFNYDTLLVNAPPPAPPAPQVVQLPPLPEHHIVGVVIDEKTQQPIANAIVQFKDRPLTGLVSRADGSFETANLELGEYTFTVAADGYKAGTCSATVAATSTPAPAGAAAADPLLTPQPQAGNPSVNPEGAWNSSPSTQPPGVGATGFAGPAAPAATGGTQITSLQCMLKAAPVVGIIQGALIDGESSHPVPAARITVRDSRGRELELQTDDAGNFRFENVPVGTVHLSIDANGYLPTAIDMEVKQKGEQRSFSLNKRPKKPNVTLTAKELKLATQIHFGPNSANILPDSQAIVQEVAWLLNQHPELRQVEIQGYTDETGESSRDKMLSRDRAESVRAALVALGVDGARLTTTGFGSDKLAAPSTSEANRAKNRRIVFVVQQKAL